MSLADDFTGAQERVKKLSRTPANDDLLQLYALYKQGVAGDVSGKKPGMLDIKARAKYGAWSSVKGLSRDEAMQRYVDLVARLVSQDT